MNLSLLLKLLGSGGVGYGAGFWFAQATHIDERTFVPLGLTASALTMILGASMWISRKITLFEQRLIVLETRAQEDRATAEKRHDELLRRLEKVC